MPTLSEALALAIQHHQEGRLPAAEDIYRQILQVEPNQPEALHLLGVIAYQVGKHQVAAELIDRAIQFKGNDPDFHNNLGVALKNQGKLEEAAACYRRALELSPHFTSACNNLGNALAAQGELDEAIACYHRVLESRPDFAEAYSNLGLALVAQGKRDEAKACYGKALQLKPDNADAHLNQSLLWLLSGDFERGWGEYEWRWQTKLPQHQPRGFSQELWDGRPFPGKTILLHAEQGLGDTIQFIRYAPLVKQRGGTVVCECPPALTGLLKGVAGIDFLVPRGQPLPSFDYQVPLLSLPGVFQTRLATIPADIPYLRPDPQLVEFWRKDLQPLKGFKVGLVWQGSTNFRWDRLRSIPLSYFKTLARVKGVHFISLQKGPGASQMGTLAGEFPILDLEKRLETFRDTTAVLMNLDLVISSCTAVPHLAGVLGVPVWLALPFSPDWRWLLEREDSPWYPHHRLFRQPRPGAWGEVFDRIANELYKLVSSREGT